MDKFNLKFKLNDIFDTHGSRNKKVLFSHIFLSLSQQMGRNNKIRRMKFGS